MQTRMQAFSEAELSILEIALGETIVGLLDAGLHDQIPEFRRADAANTLLIAARLSFEVDAAAGRVPPPLEQFAITAQMIADGTYGAEMREVIAEAAARGPMAPEDAA